MAKSSIKAAEVATSSASVYYGSTLTSICVDNHNRVANTLFSTGSHHFFFCFLISVIGIVW